jgi:dienelactone hydrolase
LKFGALVLALAPALWAGGADIAVPLRGRTQTLAHIEPANDNARAAVMFMPGDGGWRGAAITMSRAIASWNYDVYGFDTKRYLEGFSANGASLSREQMSADMRALARAVIARSGKPLLLVGWSQGAAMAVAAFSGSETAKQVHGVITLGLPESGVLGWDWKSTLASLAGREPDQPSFAVKPLIPEVGPAPLWMIVGTKDEYTTPEHECALFAAAKEPRHLHEIAGANHRFDGHESELYASLKQGLEWIEAH